MKQILFPILILIISSCGEPDYCDVFNHQEPSFIFINVLDKNDNENLLFGNNSSLSIDEIDVQIKTDDSTYTSGLTNGVLNNEDSVLLIHLREVNSSLQPPLVDELIINYNNQFPSDTINIDYITGNCENATSVPYDYNITSNTGDICFQCFKEVIDIFK